MKIDLADSTTEEDKKRYLDVLDLMWAVADNLPVGWEAPGDIQRRMISRGESGTTIGRPYTVARVRATLEILASQPEEYRVAERLVIRDGARRMLVRFRKQIR